MVGDFGVFPVRNGEVQSSHVAECVKMVLRSD